jgi:hypothetical protein
MLRSAAFIGATLGLALSLGGCSTEKLGLPPGTGGEVVGQDGSSTGGTTASSPGGGGAGTGGTGMTGGTSGGSPTGATGGGPGDTGGGGTGNISGTGAGSGTDTSGTGPSADGGPCSSNGDCAVSQRYCMRAACGDAVGVCTPMPPEMTCMVPTCSMADPPCIPPTDDADAVCGCDNVTYANACDAAAHGVSSAPGVCSPNSFIGKSCRTIADCGGDAYAKVVACLPTSCGSVFATCVPIGQACLATSSSGDGPVCGCNGLTYSDTCGAHEAGWTVAPAGSGTCPSCSDGPHCSFFSAATS